MTKGSNLVIVESPSKAKTIGKYLGPDYRVEACMGHLRDLPKSKMGVDLEHDFEPDYQPLASKAAIISELRSASKAAKHIYLATDPDREGEAISWHLKELLELPDDKTERVTFNEITKNVVTRSIQEPRSIDYNLVDAQQARRILDRIVGYQLSPLLWKKIRRGLSAGRVQSVATRLVVEREQEIEAFVPKEYWTIDVLLRCLNKPGSFTAHYYGEEKKRELHSKAEADEQPQVIAGFREDVVEVLEPSEIYRVFAESGKVFAETNHGEYALRLRLYEAEQRLDSKTFVRISNSDIINLRKVKSFDLSFVGTICITLSNGTVTYVSRRSVAKIKQLLGM